MQGQSCLGLICYPPAGCSAGCASAGAATGAAPAKDATSSTGAEAASRRSMSSALRGLPVTVRPAAFRAVFSSYVQRASGQAGIAQRAKESSDRAQAWRQRPSSRTATVCLVNSSLVGIDGFLGSAEGAGFWAWNGSRQRISLGGSAAAVCVLLSLHAEGSGLAEDGRAVHCLCQCLCMCTCKKWLPLPK